MTAIHKATQLLLARPFWSTLGLALMLFFLNGWFFGLRHLITQSGGFDFLEWTQYYRMGNVPIVNLGSRPLWYHACELAGWLTYLAAILRTTRTPARYAASLIAAFCFLTPFTFLTYFIDVHFIAPAMLVSGLAALITGRLAARRGTDAYPWLIWAACLAAFGVFNFMSYAFQLDRAPLFAALTLIALTAAFYRFLPAALAPAGITRIANALTAALALASAFWMAAWLAFHDAPHAEGAESCTLDGASGKAEMVRPDLPHANHIVVTPNNTLLVYQQMSAVEIDPLTGATLNTADLGWCGRTVNSIFDPTRKRYVATCHMNLVAIDYPAMKLAVQSDNPALIEFVDIAHLPHRDTALITDGGAIAMYEVNLDDLTLNTAYISMQAIFSEAGFARVAGQRDRIVFSSIRSLGTIDLANRTLDLAHTFNLRFFMSLRHTAFNDGFVGADAMRGELVFFGKAPALPLEATLDLGERPRRIRIMPSGTIAAVTEYYAGKLAIVDLKSRKLLYEFAVGARPLDTAWHAATGSLFVSGGCGIVRVRLPDDLVQHERTFPQSDFR